MLATIGFSAVLATIACMFCPILILCFALMLFGLIPGSIGAYAIWSGVYTDPSYHLVGWVFFGAGVMCWLVAIRIAMLGFVWPD